MRRSGLLLVTCLVVATFAFVGLRAQDARAVIAAASKAMGADGLRSVEYSATSGSTYAVGQAPGPGRPWPRFDDHEVQRRDQLRGAGHARGARADRR